MKPTPIQLALAAATTLVAGAIAWLVLERRGNPDDSVRLIDNAAEAEALLVERKVERVEAPAGVRANYADAVLQREPLSSVDAPKLFTMPADFFVYDPFTYYRYISGYDNNEAWEEYPGGFYHKTTSSDGFREDFEKLGEHHDLFVVAVGDSHTDGLCANKDTFANRLEAMLAAKHPGKAIEVLNAGVSGFSFYNYLGALEKFADRKPDAFVVAFYSGNDFLDMIRPWHYFQHTVPPPRRAGYWEQIEAAVAVSNASVAIAFHQLLYFQYHPDQVEIAIDAAAVVSAQIRRVCKEQGIQLVYVHIPPGFDDSGELKPMFAQVKDVLRLSDYDMRQYDHLADRLIEILRGMDVEVIDLRKHFTDDIDTYYWRDLHINLKGHQLIADLLLPRITALCPIQ